MSTIPTAVDDSLLIDAAYLNSIKSSVEAVEADLSVRANPGLCEGRLTVVSATPVPSTDQAAAGTLYFTPYRGARVALWSGSAWVEYTLAEVSLALASLTSGKNYDVFIKQAAGVLGIELGAAWTDDTTRQDAIAVRSGVRVKSSDHTRRLVGTIRATGAATTADTEARRFVWNQNHRVPRRLLGASSTASWTYGTDAWRQMNNGDSAFKREWVCGESDTVEIWAVQQVQGSGTRVGISIDALPGSIDAAETLLHTATQSGGSTTTVNPYLRTQVEAGYRYALLLEASYSGTATYYGNGPAQKFGVTVQA